MTPVPKIKSDLKTWKDIRKLASTSDYAKIFELFLRGWITEDIVRKLDIHRFAGRNGSGTEHMLVLIIDIILGLLDKPGMRAEVKASVVWASAFLRTDPTRTITKFIQMGIWPSVTNVPIDFFKDRQMYVCFNLEESSLYSLIGGGPQGSWIVGRGHIDQIRARVLRILFLRAFSLRISEIVFFPR